MYPELATPSAPPASPTLSLLPPPYEEPQSIFSNLGAAIIAPVTSPNSENTAVSATRNAQIFSAPRQNQNRVNHPITEDNDDDDAGYNYYGRNASSLDLILIIIVILAMAAACIFAGFTLLFALKPVVDEKSKNTNFTLLFGTVGSMVGLYQTDAIKKIMNATVAKMEILLNWDNMSNTTHEFLSFNVAITLSIMAGALAQALVNGAIAAKDEHSRNKMRM